MLDHAMDNTLPPEEHASKHLAGGLANHGYQCGMPWGAALFAGAEAYRLHGTGPQAEASAITSAKRVVESFRSFTKNRINCYDITGLDLTGNIRLTRESMKFLVKGGPLYCLLLLRKYTRSTYAGIQSNPPEMPETTPSPPVSCAALVAQKAGASEMQAVMAAGFAGGIGLSGGGCGALGAAVWIIGMNSGEEEPNKKVGNEKINETFDKFTKHTESKIECSAIVERQFESIADHAAYLHGGGCGEIIELLAAEARQ